MRVLTLECVHRIGHLLLSIDHSVFTGRSMLLYVEQSRLSR